jgi:glutamine synthetase
MPTPQRFAALQKILRRRPVPTVPLEKLWASDVFTLDTMKAFLPKGVFRSVQRTIQQGGKLNLSMANVVAKAMKTWASSHGALCRASRTAPPSPTASPSASPRCS